MILSGTSLPNGVSFIGSNRDLEPFQPIRRIDNPEWTRASDIDVMKTSKFLLDPILYENTPFAGLFNLIGAFLSINPAPKSATPHNFYIPLMGRFEQWCHAFWAKSPFMIQCTWIAQGMGKGSFFLGASCAGYKTQRNTVYTGTWDHTVKHSRYSLLDDSILQRSGYSMNNCTKMRDGKGVWLGNCAETIPFVKLHR